MASQQVITSQINVREGGFIEVQHDTIFFDDNGVRLGVRHHRTAYYPGSPEIVNEEQRVQNVAAQIWTPEVIQAYHDNLRKLHLSHGE